MIKKPKYGRCPICDTLCHSIEDAQVCCFKRPEEIKKLIIPCTTCRGTGVDVFDKRECNTCKGTGSYE